MGTGGGTPPPLLTRVYIQSNLPTVQNQAGDGAPGQSSGPGGGWQLLNLFGLLPAETHLLQVKPWGWCRAEEAGWVPAPFSASDIGCVQGISMLPVCLGFQPGPLGPGAAGVKLRAVVARISQPTRQRSPAHCSAVFLYLPLPVGVPGCASGHSLLSYTGRNGFSEEHDCCCASSVWQLHFTAVKAATITIKFPASLFLAVFSLWIYNTKFLVFSNK